MISVSIENIQEIQARNQQMVAALRPSGALGEAVKVTALELQRYAISITHVGRYIQTRTGRWRYARPHEELRASHRIAFSDSGANTATATISIDAGSANPVVYGKYEHRRGGEHAFYARAVRERGTEAMNRGRAAFKRGFAP